MPAATASGSVDVVVVGARVAGLVAARHLVRRGFTVVVLEARDRVGGRVLNEEICDGVAIEMGGQWVGPGQDRVLGLVGFLDGKHADAAARLTPGERRRQVLADLAGYFGPAATEPTAYRERDWAAEQYTRGCYGAFANPAALTRFGRWLRAPVGPVHWAGTETATRWAGYIDGAVESGQRAAEEAACALDRTEPADGQNHGR